MVSLRHAMTWCAVLIPSMNHPRFSFLPAAALAVGLSLVLSACSSVNSETGTQMSADKIAQIKKGVTTRAQVEALLGSPASVSMMPEGKRVMSYTYTSTQASGHATAASFIPVVGLFAGGTKVDGQMRIQTLQIMLNAQGIVDDYEFSDRTNNLANTSGGFLGMANQSTASTTQPTAGK